MLTVPLTRAIIDLTNQSIVQDPRLSPRDSSDDEGGLSKFVAGLAPIFHCLPAILESYHKLTISSYFYTLQSLTLSIYPVP
jgi:hypothetical protein